MPDFEIHFEAKTTGPLKRSAGEVERDLRRNTKAAINKTFRTARDLVRKPYPHHPNGLWGKVKLDAATLSLQQARLYTLDPEKTELVENNTKPHMIYPVHAKVLRFTTKGGTVFFVKSVKHPGTKGKHSWRNAKLHIARWLMPRVAQAIENALRGSQNGGGE